MEAPTKGLAVRMAATPAAQTAVKATCFPDGKLGFPAQAFRFVAPDTPQRTALQKHRGPQPRAVMDPHFFYIKYNPGHKLYSCRAITWS